MFSDPLTFAGALVVAALLGALLPLFRTWSERGLHALLSVSAGIFLGAVFLHFLPELAAAGAAADAAAGHAGHGHAGHDHAGHDHGHAGGHVHSIASLLPWIAALIGFLALFLIERVWLANRDAARAKAEGEHRDPHHVLWAATLVGLSVHAGLTGVALAGTLSRGVSTLFAVTFLVHKLAEGFSLATVMRLAGLSQTRSLGILFLFAFVTPLTLLFGAALGDVGQVGAVFSGFAAGAFLYVAVLDLLPEVFHGHGRSLPKILLLFLGLALAAVSELPPEDVSRFVAALGSQSLAVFVEMAPYLLFGFAIAGLIHVGLKPEWITRHLAKDDTKSVAAASILGAPLPLCSCSVIPVAVSMRKSGASKGATSSFLIATPETGVDSVSVTWALFDPVMTIARPIGAILSAIVSGSVVNQLVRRGLDEAPKEPEPESAGSCCKKQAALAKEASTDDHVHAPAEGGVVRRALRFAFGDMLGDLAGPLLFGVLISGFLAASIPDAVFQQPLVQGFGGLLLMLVVGIPIYVCASASTPIAAVLVMKGMSPGAALVFLLASPATNLGALLVLAKTLGMRVMIASTITLAIVTLFLGWLLNQVYGWLALEPVARAGSIHEHGSASWFQIACAVLLGALMLRAIVKGFQEKKPEPVDAPQAASTA